MSEDKPKPKPKRREPNYTIVRIYQPDIERQLRALRRILDLPVRGPKIVPVLKPTNHQLEGAGKKG
jgi:hypothetical protein